MGCQLCYELKRRDNNNKPKNSLAPEEKEIKFQVYKSTGDEFLGIIEEDKNIFRYVQLIEYINYLEEFEPETATTQLKEEFKTKYSSKDEFLTHKLSVDEFQSFIENKILKIKDLKEIAAGDENMVSIFKDSFREIYTSLKKKLNQYFGEEIDDRITKKHLISICLLFCSSSNISKVKLFFDFFKNEQSLIQQSKELNEFLITLFLISSYCMISARNKVGKIYESIGPITKENLKKLINTSELKDNVQLVDVFNKNFFFQESLNWQEFKSNFDGTKNNFGWIFSAKGIRKKLEENNIE